MTSQLILTSDPDFASLAAEEFAQSSPGARLLATLAPGVDLYEVAELVVDLAERWRQQPPVFVRHLCPVQWMIPLQASLTDIDLIRTVVQAELPPTVDLTRSLSVQTRLLADLPYKPFDLNSTLAATLQEQTGVSINVRTPEQILSVVCAAPHWTAAFAPPSAPVCAFVGLSEAVHNVSDWAGGMRRFARDHGQISRAEFKLLEALELFGINLPDHGVALDLGAAPGGWTRVLRQRGQYVTAIDPADLDPRLAQDRGVRHKRMSAERYLADDPDQFDLIVNDMRMDARDSARLMVDYAQLLYPHGWALMTLKLPEYQRKPAITHALAILRQAYHLAGARHLFHNRSEITLYLRPLSGAGDGAKPGNHLS